MSDEDSTDKKNKIREGKHVTRGVVKLSRVTTPILAKAAANILLGSSIAGFPRFALTSEKKRTLAEEKTELLQELEKLEIDPEIFDALLTNELDRKLKVSFGVAFLVLTCLFTIASYAIVILNSIYKWGISEVAITALIIETPIQFIGLLYIIARNLFPQSNTNNKLTSSSSGGKKRTA